MRKHLLFILLILTLNLAAQNNVYSPYSYYGIGLPASQNGVFSLGMGGIGQAVGGSTMVNTSNPASYAYNQKVNFEFNIYGKLTTLHDSAGYYDFKTYNFGRMNLAFPIGKKKNTGASFGVMPLTYAGYDMQRKFTTPLAHTDYYSGKGGVNKVYLGAGHSFNKYITIGANINYLFGNLSYKRTTTFDTAYINNYYLENQTIIRGLNFDLGIQLKAFKQTIKDSIKYRQDDSVYVRAGKHKAGQDSMVHIKKYAYRKDNDTITYIFTWGATYKTGSNANALRDVYGVTFKDYYLPFSAKSISVNDTVKYSVDEKGKVVIPGSLAIGFSVSNQHKTDGRNNFLISGEFDYSNWSAYRNYGNIDSMHESYSVRLGGYYKPAKLYRTDYFNLVEYRMGAHYTRTPLMMRGNTINDYGISIGLGLPIVFKNHTSGIINLALEAGKMGTISNNLTADNYIKLSLGFNLLSEQWFQHYKYE